MKNRSDIAKFRKLIAAAAACLALAAWTVLAPQPRFAECQAGAAENDPKRGITSIDLGKGQYLDMVSISAGTFQMGTGDFDWVKHTVVMTKPYWISRYPVTVGQWKRVMMTDVDPSFFKKGDNYPVENVTWYDCRKFMEALNNRYFAYGTFRLPTEAEWEYACRAATTTYFYWGDKMDGNYCWYHDNAGGATHPVGQKKPNAWGLYDMSGNVWEWCDDWMAPYPADTVENPVGPGNGLIKVFRGGAWNTYSSKTGDYWYYGGGNCRSGDRGGADPAYKFHFAGFRVALTPAQ